MTHGLPVSAEIEKRRSLRGLVGEILGEWPAYSGEYRDGERDEGPAHPEGSGRARRLGTARLPTGGPHPVRGGGRAPPHALSDDR